MEYCFAAVIRYLNSDEIVWSPAQDGEMEAVLGKEKQAVVTLGRAMWEGLPYLESHLKIALLGYSSSRPTSTSRLSDRSIRSLLLPPPSEPQASSLDEEWDDLTTPALDRTTLIHHLALTIHPAPHVILRNVTSLPLAALTSLDLAYSVILKETDKLVNALPIGLRELGLVGVRSQADEEEWTRFLVMVGRKLIVLKVSQLPVTRNGRELVTSSC